ncbi:transposon Ty3-I Gag-Pol polyprotein [Trichonephila clavipes]|nr:transposon Ty3-I Gag-Pol polyprotein [Trichonephila clavipes]
MAFGGSLPQINLGVQGVTQGGHHKDADSLSRNPVEDEVFPSEQKTTLASFSDIAEEQKYRELSKLIHFHEKAEPVMRSFNLMDGILCEKNFDQNRRKWPSIILNHTSPS